MTNPIFGQIFQMRFKNQHWFIDFWKIHYFEMGQYFQCAEPYTCVRFSFPDLTQLSKSQVGELHSDNGAIHYQLNSISYKPSILRKDWKPKIQLVKLGIYSVTFQIRLRNSILLHSAQWCVFNNFSLDKHRHQIWDKFLLQF